MKTFLMESSKINFFLQLEEKKERKKEWQKDRKNAKLPYIT